MTGENLSQQIPVGTVLGGRYEITAQIIITAESDMILEGKDQILNRKVSVVVASPVRISWRRIRGRWRSIAATTFRFSIWESPPKAINTW